MFSITSIIIFFAVILKILLSNLKIQEYWDFLVNKIFVVLKERNFKDIVTNKK